MNAQGPVKLGDKHGGQLPQPAADALHGDRPDLLRLRLRVVREAGLTRGQEDLERVDPGDVRGHRDDRDHPPAEPGGGGVSRVVADDDGGPGLGGFRARDRVEGNADDLPAAHSAIQPVGQGCIPSLGVIRGGPGAPCVLVGTGQPGRAEHSDGLVQGRGPRLGAFVPHVGIEKLDVFLRQANTQLHTINTTAGLTTIASSEFASNSFLAAALVAEAACAAT